MQDAPEATVKPSPPKQDLVAQAAIMRAAKGKPRRLAKLPNSPRVAIREAHSIQRIALTLALQEGCSCSDLCKLASTWDSMEERKRILRGNPLPGSKKPAAEKSKRQVSNVTSFAPDAGPVTPAT